LAADKKGDVYVFGVDIGTQSIRTSIFDLQGNCIIESRYGLRTDYNQSNRVEQDANQWWIGLKETVNKCLCLSHVSPEKIIAIGIDGTSCTVVPVDENCRPLRNALLWMDVRATKEAALITTINDPVLKMSGGKESAEWMLPKILWIKNHEPDIYEKTFKFVEPPDYLCYLLTGRWVTNYANAVHKRHYVRPQGGWPLRLLKKLNLEEVMEKWPLDVVQMGENIGGLSAKAAQELSNFKPDIVVSHSGIDAHANMIGLNVLETGGFAMSLGSSTTILGICEEFKEIPGIWGPFLDGLIRDLYVIDAGQISTGSIVNWFNGILFNGLNREFNKNPYEVLNKMACEVIPGAEGLVVLDYWQGNRTPYNDSLASGIIWGLTLKHTPKHIYRAILEGTAYGARNIFETLSKYKVPINYVCAGGGGIKNKLWLQIHADVCNIPISVSKNIESASLGCAISASVAANYYKSLKEAADNMVKIDYVVQPNKNNKRTYDYYYCKYLETYQRLKDLMHDVKSFKH